MKNFLSEQEKEILIARHKKERDKRICDRIKAVLLYDKGWTLMQIADALLLTDDTIRQHIRDYKENKKLNPLNGGSSEDFSLSQSIQLEKHLTEYTYHHIKDIIAYVLSRYDIRYTHSGMRSWLHRHGFSYKKPSLVPGKANMEEQNKWIAWYKEFKEDLQKDETICFMDGVHPTHNTQVSFGWIKKGVRKEIRSNTGRSRINLSGVIDICSRKLLFREDTSLNAESTIAFLQEIEQVYPTMRRIHLFCDNARYYRNKAVQKHLETSKIQLHFLPSYSPNLNPIERLWKWMKERVIYNTYYEHFDDFKLAVMGFLECVSVMDPESVFGKLFLSRVKDKFRAIGASC